MKIIIILLTLFSIAISQDKMILKSGEEIILKDRTNSVDYNDKSSFVKYNSKYYGKNKIALIILENGETVFRSGMKISDYDSLSLIEKSLADRRFSSYDYKNINEDLINELNEEEKQLYLQNLNKPVLTLGKAGGACIIIMLLSAFNSPTLTLFSITIGQDKMILKDGEEIILLDRTNFIDYDDSYSFIEYNSQYYAKNNIAQLILNNGEIIIRSGVPISRYNSLDIVKKAKLDRAFSYLSNQNRNDELLQTLSDKDKNLYLETFEKYNYRKLFFRTIGACALIMLISMLNAPYVQIG